MKNVAKPNVASRRLRSRCRSPGETRSEAWSKLLARAQAGDLVALDSLLREMLPWL